MKTWVLVANTSFARLFEAGERGGRMVELIGFIAPQGRAHDSAFTRERPGRVQESAGVGRHGIEPRLQPHEKHAAEFAHELAEVLERGRVDHGYQRLVLMAPPRFLGRLRGSLHDQVSRLVVDAHDKDVSHASAGDIEALLRS